MVRLSSLQRQCPRLIHGGRADEGRRVGRRSEVSKGAERGRSQRIQSPLRRQRMYCAMRHRHQYLVVHRRGKRRRARRAFHQTAARAASAWAGRKCLLAFAAPHTWSASPTHLAWLNATIRAARTADGQWRRNHGARSRVGNWPAHRIHSLHEALDRRCRKVPNWKRRCKPYRNTASHEHSANSPQRTLCEFPATSQRRMTCIPCGYWRINASLAIIESGRVNYIRFQSLQKTTQADSSSDNHHHCAEVFLLYPTQPTAGGHKRIQAD